jgi:cytochrome P450
VETANVTSLRDLLSQEGRRNPYAFYAKLHELGQAAELGPREPYNVVVHGYAAADKLLRDPAFLMLDAEYLDRSGTKWRDHQVVRTLRDSIFFANGPQHTRVRRLFSQAFTARHVNALQPAIVRIIETLLDRLAELGAGGAPVDFMAQFALPMPSDVIGELLGVPDSDRPWFPERVRTFGAVLELGRRPLAEIEAADAAAVELTAYFVELLRQRRAAPREDIVSMLAQIQAANPTELSDAELVANLITLFNAGFVTTTHLLGNGLTLLLERPDALARIRHDQAFAAAFVEEVLRYEPPVQFGVRFAAEDTQVAGIPVAQGQSALVLLGAANRDPQRFPNPDVFDPSRPDNHPLSFGAGPHFCLGAALSRMEGQLALVMLVNRFPQLGLAGEPGERNQLMLRGYDHLPVRVSAPA